MKNAPRSRTQFSTLAFIGAILLGSPSRAHADRFDDGERMTERFLNHCQDLRRLDVDQVRALVQAICDAEEDDRRSVARDAASRARDKVRYDYDKLENEKKDALATLEAVINDAAFKDKHGRANDLKRRVVETWDSVDRMTYSVRGANHPVIAYMLETGQQAHRDRQSNSSYCHEAEFTVGGGRTDCLYASSSSCYVIELKPRNDRAIRRGKDQVQRYREELNRSDSADRKRLIERNGRFKDCKTFEQRVDCYKLCPDIDDNGDFRSVSVDWSTDC